MHRSKPNLFDWATSELSQDAILCWLAAWADPGAAECDLLLHKLGHNLIALIFAKHRRELPDQLTSIEIMRQHHNIDVLAIVDKTLAVCIEDKIESTEHSDQLRRYLASLGEDGFSRDRLLPTYIQCGEQGDYRDVLDAGYVIVRRRELVALLRNYLSEGGTNSIGRDFHDYLAKLETKYESFRHLPPAEWDSYAWQGYYSTLQEVLGEGEWGYVPQPTGGFWGYWLHSHCDSDCEQYLQIQERNLCFKISVEEKDNRCEGRSKWSEKILAAAITENLNVVRPRRFGNGQTMTVAMLSGDFPVVNSSGSLDLEATVAVLRRAITVLDRAAKPSLAAAASAHGE